MNRIRKSFVQFVFLAVAAVAPATTALADLDPGYTGTATARTVLTGIFFEGDVTRGTGMDKVQYGDAYVYQVLAPGVYLQVSQVNITLGDDATNPSRQTYYGSFPSLSSGTYFVRINFYNQGEGQGAIGNLTTGNVTIP